MNSNYQLLENIANFLAQGYLLEDILDLCMVIYKNNKVLSIKQKLEAGVSFDDALIEIDFGITFNEYFKFFRLKNNISSAIIQSLEICKNKDKTLKRLKKELTYPCLLIIFLMFFSLFIVYGLLPSIMQLFNEFNIEPSFFTMLIFKMFKLIPIIVITSILIFLVFSFLSIYAIKKQYFQLIDLLVTKITFLKKIIQKYYSIKFALYYNELLMNGYDSTEIIIMLYQQIDDSDIKMLIYEIYRKILEGEALETIVADFIYFEPLLITCFRLLLHDNSRDKSLDNYLKLSVDMLHLYLTKIIKLAVPFVYCFTAGFVILVYVSIIIPMMNVVSNL